MHAFLAFFFVFSKDTLANYRGGVLVKIIKV